MASGFASDLRGMCVSETELRSLFHPTIKAAFIVARRRALPHGKLLEFIQ